MRHHNPRQKTHPAVMTVLFSAVFLAAAFLITSQLHSLALETKSGDWPPTAGDWLVYNNTAIQNQEIHINGNIIVGENATLRLFNCTVYMDKNNTMFDILGSVHLWNTTVTAQPNTTWTMVVETNATATIENSSMDIGWEFNVGIYALAEIKNSTLTFLNNTHVPASYMGFQGSGVIENTTITSEGQQYCIHAVNGLTNTLWINDSKIINPGIEPTGLGAIYYPFSVGIFSNTRMEIRNTEILPTNYSGAVSYERGEGVVKNLTIRGGLFGVDLMASHAEIKDNRVYDTTAAVSVRYSPPKSYGGGCDYSTPTNITLPRPRITGCVFKNNTYGVALDHANVSIENTTIENSEYAIYGINSAFEENNNTYHNTTRGRAIIYAKTDLVVYRGDGDLADGATVEIEETGWRDWTSNGRVSLNGTTGLLALYTDNNDTTHTYTYHLHISYNTGIRTFWKNITLNPLQAPSTLEVYVPAGPDLVLEKATLSTEAAPPGADVIVQITVKNEWPYPVENVTVVVETPQGYYESTIDRIEANNTATINVTIKTPRYDTEKTVEVTVFVDPNAETEGQYMSQDNNEKTLYLTVKETTPGTVPPMAAIGAAITVLLALFLYTFLKSIRSGTATSAPPEEKTSPTETAGEKTSDSKGAMEKKEEEKPEKGAEPELPEPERPEEPQKEPAQAGETEKTD